MKITPTTVLAIMLAFASLYFYQDPEWNGNSRLDAIRAVVEQGTFRIDSYQAEPGWSTMDKSVYAGHYYTDKGIGSSLLGIPIYFILYRLAHLSQTVLSSVLVKHVLTAIVMGSAFTLNGVLLFLIARQITANQWKAALAALAVSLGTMLWPYSAVYYGHVPAAMFVAMAFYLLLVFKQDAQTHQGWLFFAAGLAMGMAFITEYPTALIIVGLLAYAAYALRGQPLKTMARLALMGTMGALLPLSLMFFYNHVVYGSIFRSGYSHVAVLAYQKGLEHGFMGITAPNLRALYHFTFDPAFGVFWQSPVLLMCIPGLIAAFRSRRWRAECVLAVYSIAAIFLMNAGYFMWWGGSAFGARYIIPALPFFVIPLALVPDGLTWLMGGLTALSAGQMLIPLLGAIQINIGFEKPADQFFVFGPFRGFSLLYQYGLPLIFGLARTGVSPWTLGTAFGLPIEVSAGVFAGVEAVLASVLHKMTKISAGHVV